jgi:hypothetical protein
MPRKSSPWTFSPEYNRWINNTNASGGRPGFKKYKETPTSPESRVESFLEGTPKFDDVRQAHYGGKITTEEAQDLRPNDYFPDNVGRYKDKSTEATHRRAFLKG